MVKRRRSTYPVAPPNPSQPGLRGPAALILLGFVIGAAQPAQTRTEEAGEPAITVSIEGSSEVAEDAAMATLSLRAATAVDRRPQQAVEVHIARGGSATESADYDMPLLQASSYVVTLAPEAFTRSSEDSLYVATHELTVYIFDDREDEPDETIVVTPGHSDAPDHVTFAEAHTLAVLDNDEPQITVSFGGPSQIDEDGGATTITVRARTASTLAPRQPIQFRVRLGGTAKPPGVNYVADFESANFPYNLTLAAEDFRLSTDSGGSERYVAAFEFAVNVTDDTEDEPDETIELTIAYAPVHVSLAAPYTLTIVDDDVALPELAITDATADESAAQMFFEVTTSSPGADPVTVDYATTDDTATAGADYTTTSGTLTFPADSAAARTIRVPLLSDPDYEGDETFTVTLTGATNATIASAAAIGTIADDDGAAVRIYFETASYTAEEGGGAQVTVLLSEAPGRALEIPLTATPGNGASTNDFKVPASVAFSSDETTRAFQLGALLDGETEVGETLTLTFGAFPAGVSASAPATATVTFTDPVPVDIPDAALRAALEQALEKTAGETIYRWEMETLERLNASRSGVADLTGLGTAENLKSLILSQNQVSDLSALVSLTSLKYLDLFRNQIADLTPLASLVCLEHLNLGVNQITNIAPLANLRSLQFLGLERNLLAELPPFTTLRSLQYLVLRDNQLTGVNSLASLSSLLRLSLDRNQITDITPLTSLITLTTLGLHGNPIASFDPLSGLTSLSELALSSTQISDLTPLAGLTSLERLRLANNPIVHIAKLAPLTSLKLLSLQGARITDISPLRSLTSLVDLNLNYNGGISDISPLAGLTSLSVLRLSGNQLRDITSLATLTSLEFLDLGGNQVSGVASLANLTSLQMLFLGSNRISNIAPVSHLSSLRWLLLAANEISDITPIATMTSLVYLDFASNEVANVSALADQSLLRTLVLGHNRISDFTPLDALPNLIVHGKDTQSVD